MNSKKEPTQIESTQIGSTQIGSTQIGSTQIGSTQIGSTQIGSTQIGSTCCNYLAVVNKFSNSLDYIDETVNNMINELLEKDIPLPIIIGETRRACNKLIKDK